MPETARTNSALWVPAILVINLQITTFFFVAGLMLLERDEGMLNALAVSPLSPSPSDRSPSWSPDASRIAYASGTDILVMDVASGAQLNLTNTASLEYAPAWSPDGRRIAFISDRDGQAELYLMGPDGSGVVRTNTGVSFRSWSRLTWFPDSTAIGFDCEVDAGNDDICVISANGTGFRRLTQGPGRDINPAWSPDGRQIAFATDSYAADQTLLLALMGTDGSAVTVPQSFDISLPFHLPETSPGVKRSGDCPRMILRMIASIPSQSVKGLSAESPHR